MENNYSVYQHVTPDGLYYFGQTQNVEKRWSKNGAGYKKTALQPYIEKFGWDNIKHIVLFKDQTRENALWIENFLIETAREDGVCINKKRSGLVSKEEGYAREYYEQNKEQIREKQQQYCQKNKDKKQDYDKQYYEENKDKRLKYKKQYYEQNKENIREYNRQRYQKNRDEINERRRQRYQKNRDKELEQRHIRYQRKKLEQQLKEVQTTLF